MVASTLVDLVKIYATSTGTGALTLGQAVPGFRGREALLNGGVYSYSIQQGDQFETGKGTFLTTGNQLVRSPNQTSNGGTAINVQAGTAVAFVALAEDILARDVLQPLYGFGAPLPGQGQTGQVYYDLNKPVTLYGPKTASGWGVGVVLQGDPGTANVFSSLTLFKASDVAKLSATIVGSNTVTDGDFDFKPGDYSGQADDQDIVKADAVPLTTGAWVRRSAVSTTFRQAGAAARRRNVQDKARDIVSVKDFGAIGDGTADDTAAITAALAFLNSLNGGTLLYPKGTYRTSSPIALPYRVQMVGVGGHVGSLINGTHAGNIFEAANLAYSSATGLAFTGSGCTAFRQTGSGATSYFEGLWVRRCHFYGQLLECIYANLIHPEIHDSTFGYYGTVGAAHRHIVSLGSGTNTTNCINVSGNRFFYAKGNESVRFDSGVDLKLIGNTWEQNQALPIRLKGMYNASVKRNYFELNSGTQFEIELSAGGAVIDSSATRIDENNFVHASSITRVVNVVTPNFDANGWSFRGNTGSSVAVTNDYSHLSNSTGDIQFVDASGETLGTLGNTTKYKRDRGSVIINHSFTFPTTTNTNPNKIGGLPFPSDGVAVGKVLSNLTGGADIATDAGAMTMTLFKPGTTMPFTNAELSGKLIYLSVTYFVPGV